MPCLLHSHQPHHPSATNSNQRQIDDISHIFRLRKPTPWKRQIKTIERTRLAWRLCFFLHDGADIIILMAFSVAIKKKSSSCDSALDIQNWRVPRVLRSLWGQLDLMEKTFENWLGLRKRARVTRMSKQVKTLRFSSCTNKGRKNISESTPCKRVCGLATGRKFFTMGIVRFWYTGVPWKERVVHRFWTNSH